MMRNTEDPQADSDVDDDDPSSQSGRGEGVVSIGQDCEDEGDEYVDVDNDGVF